MVDDRAEDESPFDAHEKGEGMDFLHLDFIDVRGMGPLDQGGVYQQMNHDIEAEEDAGEGMEAAEEEMVPTGDGGEG